MENDIKQRLKVLKEQGINVAEAISVSEAEIESVINCKEANPTIYYALKDYLFGKECDVCKAHKQQIVAYGNKVVCRDCFDHVQQLAAAAQNKINKAAKDMDIDSLMEISDVAGISTIKKVSKNPLSTAKKTLYSEREVYKFLRFLLQEVTIKNVKIHDDISLKKWFNSHKKREGF